jgi:hypothetical protein
MSSFNLDTRKWIAAAALALAGGAIAAGCGSDPGIDFTQQTTFCQQVAQADCSALAVQACYGADGTSLETDTTTCISVRSSPEHCNPLNLPYHSMYAPACVAAHAAVYAQNPLDPNALAAMELSCTAVLNKGGTQGASCSADTDCAGTGDATGFVCVIHQGTGGKCEVPVPVSAGDTCAAPASACVAGYYCDTGGHCVEDPVGGQACGPGISCGAGFFCDAQSFCTAQLQDNQACTASSDCVGQFCVGAPGMSVCSHTFTLALLSPTCSDFK